MPEKEFEDYLVEHSLSIQASHYLSPIFPLFLLCLSLKTNLVMSLFCHKTFFVVSSMMLGIRSEQHFKKGETRKEARNIQCWEVDSRPTLKLHFLMRKICAFPRRHSYSCWHCITFRISHGNPTKFFLGPRGPLVLPLVDLCPQDKYGSLIYTHIGQFPQDGENGQSVTTLKKNWNSAVTKRFDFFNFSQLFWRDFACWILKMFSFWSQLV